MDNNELEPKVAHGKVPGWIRVMWFFGILWVIYYIYTGLQQGSLNW